MVVHGHPERLASRVLHNRHPGDHASPKCNRLLVHCWSELLLCCARSGWTDFVDFIFKNARPIQNLVDRFPLKYHQKKQQLLKIYITELLKYRRCSWVLSSNKNEHRDETKTLNGRNSICLKRKNHTLTLFSHFYVCPQRFVIVFLCIFCTIRVFFLFFFLYLCAVLGSMSASIFPPNLVWSTLAEPRYGEWQRQRQNRARRGRGEKSTLLFIHSAVRFVSSSSPT